MAREYLDKNGLTYLWGKLKLKFAAISHSHTKSDITDFSHTHVQNDITNFGHTHGNLQDSGDLQSTDVSVASGDKIVVTDASDNNKVARTSVTFDGSTTNKALTPKGTWEAFLQSLASAYGSIKVGNSTMSATGSSDMFEIAAGTGISLTAGTRKVTINGTTYSDFAPADSNDNGTHGLVPAPTSQMYNNGDTNYFLCADGSWGLLPIIGISEMNKVITITEGTNNDYAAISVDQKGAASGVCPLDATGKVSTAYLPSFVAAGSIEFEYNGSYVTMSEPDSYGTLYSYLSGGLKYIATLVDTLTDEVLQTSDIMLKADGDVAISFLLEDDWDADDDNTAEIGKGYFVVYIHNDGSTDWDNIPFSSGSGMNIQVLSATKSYSTNSERVSLSNGTTAATILSVTAPVTGYVIVTGHVQMTANQNGNRHAEITKGNTVLAQTTQRAGSSGQTTIVQVSWAGECTQGDTIAIKAWQTAGSGTTLYAGGLLTAMFIG